jgi:hypothetical protein
VRQAQSAFVLLSTSDARSTQIAPFLRTRAAGQWLQVFHYDNNNTRMCDRSQYHKS